MRITVLIENTALSDTLTAEHGLSLYLEYRGTSWLLDAGTSGAFAANADKLEIDLAKVETCLLSHGHYDHAGGLAEFFRRNQTAPVYAMHGADQPYYSGDGEKRHDIGIPGKVLEALPRRVHWVDGGGRPLHRVCGCCPTPRRDWSRSARPKSSTAARKMAWNRMILPMK